MHALQTPVVLNAIIFPSKGREASNERTVRNNDIVMSVMRELKENSDTVINYADKDSRLTAADETRVKRLNYNALII